MRMAAPPRCPGRLLKWTRKPRSTACPSSRYAKNAGKWEYVKESGFNRRMTPLTDIDISGPARGNALLVTKYSPEGTRTAARQQLRLRQNALGHLPEQARKTGPGLFLPCSPRRCGRRNDKSVVRMKRYGRFRGAASRHGWESERHRRLATRAGTTARPGASADGSDDYRNEMNTFGYIVEIDPYDKNRALRKRTALGRILHESAAFGRVVVDQPVAAYMGDDARNEYIYKYVSDALWRAPDSTPALTGSRPATGTSTAASCMWRSSMPTAAASGCRFRGQSGHCRLCRATHSTTRPTWWSMPAWLPTPPAQRRWTGPNGARSIPPMAKCISR